MEETLQHAEVIEITLEKKIETALVRNNVTDAVIAQLKAKYGNLKLASLDDKESYLEVKQAKKDCAKLRNLASKVCKEGREEANKIQKLWVAKEKEVIGKIDEVESPLDEEIEKYDKEQERKKNEEIQRQENEYMRRTQLLTKMGALYTEGCFCIGDFSIEANLVKESSIDVWEESMLPKFEKEYQKIEAERVDRERIEMERKEQERKEREEFERQQAEFKRQQEEFRRQQIEAEQKKERERMALQQTRLKAIAPYNPYNKGIDVNGLWNMGEAEFIALVDDTKAKYEVEQEQRQREIAEKAAQAERERIAEEQRQAEIKRQQEEARKAEELAKAGDKVKWEHFIEEIKKIVVPNCKSGQYRNAATSAQLKLDEILNLTPKIK